MGTSLHLEISEGRNAEKLLYDYYDYKLQKKVEIKGEHPPQVKESSVYNRELEKLEEGDDLFISEPETSTMADAIDMDTVSKMFDLHEGELYESSIITGEKIRCLIDTFRDAKTKLEKRKLVGDWELTLEGNQTALCEFALQKELGIWLSM